MDAIDLKQSPAPGTRLVRHQGDVLRIELVLDRPVAGRGVVRTNIGRGDITRREIIEKVTRHRPLLGKDWFDIPMQQVDDRCFRVSLPLLETGHFEAKTYFLPAGRERPQWPRGDNLSVNISAADACCANVIYNAFVRQFGAAKSDPISLSQQVRRVIDRLDADGYTVIPPSGTFRDLIACLDFIIGSLGCRYIQLLPVHPTPTTYARMGRFGSPYAALSFKAVDPALAAFDPAATPMEQFFELVDAIHDRRGKVLLDIAINHTGWAARMHESHPEWLKQFLKILNTRIEL